MRTLVLGIGNTILGDDGIGVHVARELARRIDDENIDIKDTSIDSLNLLDWFIGYDRMIVIDAIITEDEKVGEIYRLQPENIRCPSSPFVSPHHANLTSTLEMGKSLFPSEMPEEIIVYAITTHEAFEVTEEMTEKVKKSIPEVVTLILNDINRDKLN